MNHDHPVIKKMLEGWALTVALILVFFVGYGVALYENEITQSSQVAAAASSFRITNLLRMNASTSTATSTGPATTTATTTPRKIDKQAIVSVRADKSEYRKDDVVNVSWTTRIVPSKGLSADLVDEKNVVVQQLPKIDSKLTTGKFAFIFEPKNTQEQVFYVRLRDIASGVQGISNKIYVSTQSLISIVRNASAKYEYTSLALEGGDVDAGSVEFSVKITNNESYPVFFSQKGQEFVRVSITKQGASEEINFNSVRQGQKSINYTCDNQTQYTSGYNVLKPGSSVQCVLRVSFSGGQIFDRSQKVRVAVTEFNFKRSLTSVSQPMRVSASSLLSVIVHKNKLSPASDAVSSAYPAEFSGELVLTDVANSLNAAQSLLTASVLPGLSVFAEGVLALLKK